MMFHHAALTNAKKQKNKNKKTEMASLV